MKILLIIPSELINSGTEMYPSGAMLLMGTMLKNKGHTVKIVHMTKDRLTIEMLMDQVKELQPDYIGITVNTYQIASAKEITESIKRHDRKIKIVIGGPHPSAIKIDVFNELPQVDIAVIGEGENTFLEIIEGEDLKNIKGIYYRDREKLSKMQPREPEKNLDYIPLPELDLVAPISKYTGVKFKKRSPSMFIMGSRGCPFKCVYCNTSIWGSKVRYRKPEHIIEEIKHLHFKYGIKEIFFQDDTFNLNRKWVEEIFNRIIAEGLNKKVFFKTPFRVDRKLVDLDLLKLAKKANFWCIFYGVENGNQDMLNRMKKGTKIEDIIRAFKLTHKAGIKTVASFMIGNIGETKETVNDSFNLLKKIKPTYTGFGIAIPFPGTEFRYELEKRNHLLKEPYETYSSKTCVIRTDELSTEDIKKLYVKANLYAALYSPGTRMSIIKRSLQNPVKYPVYLVKILLKTVSSIKKNIVG